MACRQKESVMNWGGFLFIAIGLLSIIGSSKIVAYNRVFRKSSAGAEQFDRFCFVAVGVAAIGIGMFALFHPNGW